MVTHEKMCSLDGTAWFQCGRERKSWLRDKKENCNYDCENSCISGGPPNSRRRRRWGGGRGATGWKEQATGREIWSVPTIRDWSRVNSIRILHSKLDLATVTQSSWDYIPCQLGNAIWAENHTLAHSFEDSGLGECDFKNSSWNLAFLRVSRRAKEKQKMKAETGRGPRIPKIPQESEIPVSRIERCVVKCSFYTTSFTNLSVCNISFHKTLRGHQKFRRYPKRPTWYWAPTHVIV